SCVGVVANACIQKARDSNGTRIECYEREKAVWDARLNRAYKRLRRESEPDVRESYQKVQRAWMAYRATIRRSSSRGRWRDRCRLGAYFILPPIKRSGSKVDSNSTTRRRPSFPNSGAALTVEAPNSPRRRSHEIRLFLIFVHGFVGKCL